MKKILIFILIILFVTGCNNTLSEEKSIYQSMQEKLASHKDFNTPLTYNINVYLEKIIESEIMYRVIIDEPTVSMKNVSVLAIHDYPTEDIFPSIGIFDKKVNLIPNVIDVASNNVKGISLIGYIPYEGNIMDFKVTFKVLVEYEDELNNIKTDYYQYQN